MKFDIKPNGWFNSIKLAKTYGRIFHATLGLLSATGLLWCFASKEVSLKALASATKSKRSVLSGKTFGLEDTISDWSYSGATSPESWGALEERFALCSSGKRQSPVDIPTRLPSQPMPVSIFYQPAKTQIASNGRTFTLLPDQKNSVVLDGVTYKLISIEFHSPSEHTVSGFNYPMEVQFIHTNEQGKSLGFAVFVEKSKEKGVALFDDVLSKNSSLSKDLDLTQLMPQKRNVWSYSGSSTMPPCSENTQWFVFADTIEFSTEQISEFRKLYPLNSRPVQNMYDRTFMPTQFVVSH